MVTDTFFDLQRFAEDGVLLGVQADAELSDVLVGSESGFTWEGGNSFAGAGTKASPAQMVAAGTSGAVAQIPGTTIYLNGTEDGYSFAINKTSNDWSLFIEGEENVVGGDFSDEDGGYEVEGEVTVSIKQGSTEGFTETVNDAPTYVKAADGVDFGFAVDGTQFTYTFADGVSGVEIGLDEDDKAVFEGAGTDIIFNAGASSSEDDTAISFTDALVAISDGSEVISLVGDDNEFTTEEQTIAVKGTSVVFTSDGDIFGASSVVAEDGLKAGLGINGADWDKVDGVESVTFDSVGSAFVEVTADGVATVEGDAGNFAGFDSLTTAGVVVNGAKIQAVEEASPSFAVQLDTEGISGIAVDEEEGFVKVTGDNSFEVRNEQGTYKLATDANEITFDDMQDTAAVVVANGSNYSVDGADGIYSFADGVAAKASAEVGINDATVAITNNSDDINEDIVITSDDDEEGVDVISGVKVNDVVSVENDDDGYTVIFDKADGTEGEVALTVNDAVITGDASDMNESDISVKVDADGELTVTGLEAGSQVVLSGGDSGITYHITNANDSNEVEVAAGKEVIVELDKNKNVADVYSADAAGKLANNEAKWDEVATIGNPDYDYDYTHRGVAQDTFYDLSGISSTQLGFDDDDDEEPTTVPSVINMYGESVRGIATSLGDAAHVSLVAGSGNNAGAVPLSIQENENDDVVDVTVNLTNTREPSTVAVGTTGYVTASHKVYLSNSGDSDDPNYGYFGEGATGQNLLQAGNGAAMLRHDGDNRTSVFGGAGDDTIRPDENDVVKGNGGADVFFDDRSYTIDDYDATEGDAIVATRFDSVDDIDIDNVSGTGNQVQFGTGKTLTIGSKDSKTSYLHVKAAVLDNDGDVADDRRDVVLATAAGTVDASAADGALIIADSTRGGFANYITGSDGDDKIYAGANDSIDGGEGDDDITINDGGTGVVVGLGDDGGSDTVRGWEFGFDKNEGNTQLYLGGAKFDATTKENSLVVTTEDGSSLTIEDTNNLIWYDILVDDKKYLIVRSEQMATVGSNDNLADIYFAEADGGVIFTNDVTEDLGLIVLGDGEDYENIRRLGLFNNSKASVIGSAERETVALGGDVSANAGKAVSLAGGNDVIISSDDDGPSNVFFFGAGDGRDTINSFGHYLGVEKDPDKQMADVLVIEDFKGMRVDRYDDGDRIVFNTSDVDDVVIYEDGGLDVNDKMYLVKVDGADVGVAKIGYTEGEISNNFTFDKEVNFYVGSDATATDTLTIGDDVNNVEVWLDGTGEDDYRFYRGIGVIDAREATATEMTLVGSMDDNTIYGGGEGSSDILWGGAGDNLLIGGDGEDIFVYAKDSRDYIEGAETLDEANHDTISGYDADNDTIFLGDITLDDIDIDAMADSDDGGIGESTVTVRFKNGGTLTVNGTQEETKFNLADGSVYTATRSTTSWS